MRKRLMLAGALAALVTLTFGGSALAGGWSVASFNDVPAEMEAGTTYTMEYTVLAHGQRPVSAANSGVSIWSPETGESYWFPGSVAEANGLHTVQVTFPNAGVWEWELQQSGYTLQSLGSVTIGGEGAAGSASGGTSLLQITLPVAALGLAYLTALQGYWLLRDRRQRSTAAAPAGAGD